MCMKKFDAEKIFFDKTYRVFDLAIYRQLHLVNNGWQSNNPFVFQYAGGIK